MRAHTPEKAIRVEDILRLCGDIPAWKVTAIVNTAATINDLESAVAWVAGESDVMAGARRQMDEPAASIFDILTADDETGDDEPSPP